LSKFKLLADENIAKAVVEQLTNMDVHIQRVNIFLPEGTPDPDVLQYADEHGYALLTHDEQITRHIAIRRQRGQSHHGVFIAGHHLQGKDGIGVIVKFIEAYHRFIEGGAATIANDIKNQVIYI
jgi:predicted nuclease of predicted toxin-antitoxin system